MNPSPTGSGPIGRLGIPPTDAIAYSVTPADDARDLALTGTLLLGWLLGFASGAVVVWCWNGV